MADPDSRRQLAESLREALSTPASGTAADRRPAPDRGRQRLMTVALAGLGLVLAWLWIARPASVFDPIDAATLAEPTEPALRYGMYLQAARVTEFQAEHGRLPASLEEAGVAEEGLDYQVAEGGWILRGRLGGQVLELTSRMSADSFLGASSGPPGQ